MSIRKYRSIKRVQPKFLTGKQAAQQVFPYDPQLMIDTDKKKNEFLQTDCDYKINTSSFDFYNMNTFLPVTKKMDDTVKNFALMGKNKDDPNDYESKRKVIKEVFNIDLPALTDEERKN